MSLSGCFFFCSTRISNELGAGNSRAAHIVVYTAMFLAVMESLVVSMSLLVGRSVFGYVFSSDERTVDYVAKMAPLLYVSILLDGLQAVLAGPISQFRHKYFSYILIKSTMKKLSKHI